MREESWRMAMKNYLVLCMVFLEAALLISCATPRDQQPELIALPAKPERVSYPGFSIVPPQGGNWFLAQSQDPRVAMFRGSYLKKGSTVGHTIAATIGTFWVPSSLQSQFTAARLLDAIRNKSERQNTERFKLVSDNFVHFKHRDADCVRGDLVAEDRGVPNAEGKLFQFSIHMITCQHPLMPGYMIQLEYSQRVPPGVQPISIERDGDAFFESLLFDSIDARMTTFEVGRAPSGVTTARGLIWIANQDGGNASVIDPVRNKLIDTVSLESYATPSGITASGDNVWIADRSKDGVIRVDAKARRFVSNMPVENKPVSIAYGYDYVWVANNDDLLSRIEPLSSVKTNLDLGGTLTGVSLGAGSVWVGLRQQNRTKQFLTEMGKNSIFLPLLMAGDTMEVYKGSLVSRINPENMEVLANISVGKGPLSLLARDDAIWIASLVENTVYRIDPVNNKIVAMIKVGRGPWALAFHNGFIWVANVYDDDVLRIDPAANAVVGRPVPVNARPLAMISDGRSLWVANYGDNTVSRIDPVMSQHARESRAAKEQ